MDEETKLKLNIKRRIKMDNENAVLLATLTEIIRTIVKETIKQEKRSTYEKQEFRGNFPWELSEDDMLRGEVYRMIEEIAISHRRTIGAITSRIIQKNLIM